MPPPTPEVKVTASLQPTRLTSTPTIPAVPRVCSPLDGIEASDLAGQIVNPFHPPQPGSDDPHQGVDLADLAPGSGVARAGGEVQAVLAGRVAGVIQDRFPYGNAILIETPLDDLPAAWLAALPVPTPEPTLPARSALTCPTPQAPPAWDLSQRSLYLLYAHMQQAPTLPPGEAVSCGEELGSIGSTGNALNPHLHLEAACGPGRGGFRLHGALRYQRFTGGDARLLRLARQRPVSVNRSDALVWGCALGAQFSSQAPGLSRTRWPIYFEVEKPETWILS